ncbi:MAG: hypothetical protein AAF549_00280 [Pseudomonadota bacterium]
MPEVIEINFQQGVIVERTTTPQRYAYIDKHSVEPTVIGTNLPPGFFFNQMFEAASIPEKGIKVFREEDENGEEFITVNGKRTANVSKSLEAAGARYLSFF